MKESLDREATLRRWAKTVCPEIWDDIDDAWVKFWTPFQSKATLMAFFESIVWPRVKLFESWRSYKWKPLKPLDLSEKISTLEETIGKTEVRFGRSGNKRKRLLGEQVEQKLLKKLELVESVPESFGNWSTLLHFVIVLLLMTRTRGHCHAKRQLEVIIATNPMQQTACSFLIRKSFSFI
jgi:hypothetical protein